MSCPKCGKELDWEGIEGATNLCEKCFDAEALAFDQRVWCQNGHGPRHKRADCKVYPPKTVELDRTCCGAPGPKAVDAIVRSWFGLEPR
jgi:hypothetical protein